MRKEEDGGEKKIESSLQGIQRRTSQGHLKSRHGNSWAEKRAFQNFLRVIRLADEDNKGNPRGRGVLAHSFRFD